MIMLIALILATVRNSRILKKAVNYCSNIPYFDITFVILFVYFFYGFSLIQTSLNNMVEAFHLEAYFKPNHYYASYYLTISETELKKFITITEALTLASALSTLFIGLFLENKNISSFITIQQKLAANLKKYLGFGHNLSSSAFLIFSGIIIVHLAYIIAWIAIALYLKLTV